MRGTLIYANTDGFMMGIIPADAGNTDHYLSDAYKIQDHPRGCGEHILIRTGFHEGEGSSPRMRGTPCA
ncbi:hypothetical protein BAST_1426 [Bifidobacterium asteroides PRL2011]|nr:hypothetical protein BAST_1426 [Bifidobacterium asteroides PRL2011]